MDQNWRWYGSSAGSAVSQRTRGWNGRAEYEGGSSGLRGIARSLFRRGSATEAAPEAPPTGASPEPAARTQTGTADSDSILADLRAWAVEISQEGLQAADLDPDPGIFDEGYVDSMSYVELLSRIEQRYGVAIPDEQVVGSTLRDLARYVAEEAAA